MVRSDKTLDAEIVTSEEWDSDVVTGQTGKDVDRYKLPDGLKARLSFSGSERNSVFIQGSDGLYSNMSGISGLDSKKDGRSVGFIDLDRDGWRDVLITNSNSPTLEIYRNQIGQLKRENNFVAVSVVGGNKTDQPSPWASRDGIGAMISVRVGDTQMIREVRSGEGLATQNSQCYLIGLGTGVIADEVSVRWPSGKTISTTDVESGTWIKFHENVEEIDDDDGSGIAKVSYRGEIAFEQNFSNRSRPAFPINIGGKDGTFKVVAAMATWCESCKGHIPEIAQISSQMGDRVEVFAIAVDKDDSQQMLDEYVEKNSPRYTLLPKNDQSAVEFTRYVVGEVGRADLPYAVVIGPDGNVLFVSHSLPTISDLKRIIAQSESR